MCDHAGIWKVDCSDLIEDLGLEEFNLQEFISTINTEYDKISGKKITKERLLMLDNSSLWITGFIQFQYQGKDHKVNQLANAVGSALLRLEGFGTLRDGMIQLPEGSSNPYLILTTPYERGKVKVKVEVKDNTGLTEKTKHGQKTNGIVNFAAQGEILAAERYARSTQKAAPSGGTADTSGKD
jgi:hypothetical protein